MKEMADGNIRMNLDTDDLILRFICERVKKFKLKISNKTEKPFPKLVPKTILYLKSLY